ncbi:hypothetical protein DXG03_007749 [Asterophora parasitica]|uniref:Alcohol dehydrogenase-like N-terminal domain-containing protein n=1 Tax=Asterophora parasitica TaxID=117018 RepID=A0A9P7GEJ0_9AGAR|nr:hypothetical protein DXG03_007749 [Asterophora parasitica]
MPHTQTALFLESKLGEFQVLKRNIPTVTAGHLLVRVEAVGLNPVDCKIQKYGIYLKNDEDYPAIIGGDIAGSVVETGEGVSQFTSVNAVIATASVKDEAHLKSLGATHDVDQNLPIKDLASKVSTITSAPIDLIFDAVASPDTQQSAYSILADGGDLWLVHRAEQVKLVEGKRIASPFGGFNSPYSRELGMELFANLTELLKEGSIKVCSVA